MTSSTSVDLARYYGKVWRSLVLLNSHTDQSPERQINSVSKSDILIEGDLTELDDEFSFVQHVQILVTKEFVYLTELIDSVQTHLLQHSSGKVVKKFEKPDVKIELVPENSYTIKAKWEKTDDRWRIYEFIGNETLWRRLLDNFNVPRSCRQHAASVLSSADSSSDDELSDTEDVEVALPKCVTLCVAQAFSMWSMSTLNPGNVRKLAHINYTREHTTLTSTREAEVEDNIFDTLDDQTIYRSNSYPNLQNAIPFRTFSLPNIDDLESVNVEESLFPPPGSRAEEEFTNLDLSRDRNPDQTTVSNHATNLEQLSSQRRRFSGYTHRFAKTIVELQLLKKIEELRSRPSDLKFLKRNDKFCLNLHHTPPASRKLSYRLALTKKENKQTSIASALSQFHSFPRDDTSNVPEVSPDVTQNLTNKTAFFSPKKVAKTAKRSLFKDDMAIGLGDKQSESKKNRRILSIFASKRQKRTFSPGSFLKDNSLPLSKDGVLEKNDFQGKYVCKNTETNELRSSSFIVSENRRGALFGDITGKKENVSISAVRKCGSESQFKTVGGFGQLKGMFCHSQQFRTSCNLQCIDA